MKNVFFLFLFIYNKSIQTHAGNSKFFNPKSISAKNGIILYLGDVITIKLPNFTPLAHCKISKFAFVNGVIQIFGVFWFRIGEFTRQVLQHTHVPVDKFVDFADADHTNNPLRLKAKGYLFLTVAIILFVDDFGRSKKGTFNPVLGVYGSLANVPRQIRNTDRGKFFVSATSDADPLEHLEVLINEIADLEKGFFAYCSYRKKVNFCQVYFC